MTTLLDFETFCHLSPVEDQRLSQQRFATLSLSKVPESSRCNVHQYIVELRVRECFPIPNRSRKHAQPSLHENNVATHNHGHTLPIALFGLDAVIQDISVTARMLQLIIVDRIEVNPSDLPRGLVRVHVLAHASNMLVSSSSRRNPRTRQRLLYARLHFSQSSCRIAAVGASIKTPNTSP